MAGSGVSTTNVSTDERAPTECCDPEDASSVKDSAGPRPGIMQRRFPLIDMIGETAPFQALWSITWVRQSGKISPPGPSEPRNFAGLWL